MKLYLKTLCCLGMAAMIVGCGNKKAKEAEAAAKEQARLDSLQQVEFQKKMRDAEAMMTLLPEEPVFDIVTNLGTMKVKLYSKTPKHRDNFEKLALTGYYNGLLFHRVIDGFMIQGGDPYTRDASLADKYGQGGPDYTIPAEFIPEYTHKKGALAAARRGDAANPMKESSGSQFYLVQDEAACSSLNGDYTVYDHRNQARSGLQTCRSDDSGRIKTNKTEKFNLFIAFSFIFVSQWHRPCNKNK